MAHTAYKTWIDENPLRKWRLENDLSIMAVASMLGAGMSTVQTWENGAHWPKPESFEKIGGLIGDPNIEESWQAWLDSRPSWNSTKQ